MHFSKENLVRYETVYKAVGPLRYQMADADCVPTTVVNGLLFASVMYLPPTLMRLVWTASLDRVKGTGWVCCKFLAEVLQSWFSMAKHDGHKKHLSDFRSSVRQDLDVSLGNNNHIVSTLNASGVVCITLNKGGHCLLLHSHKDGKVFYGFDPWWPRTGKKRAEALLLSAKSFGICNVVWSREDLLKEFEHVDNQFVHTISRLQTCDQ